jgi:hypothetical protein
MNRVKADSALRDALTRNGEQVEVCDEAGNIIGYALTAAAFRQLQSSGLTDADIYYNEGDPFDPEEVRAALADPRRYSTDEFLKGLGLE